MSVLRNRVYYRVKPFIPQSLRTAVRQRLSTRLRDSVVNIWPIMPGSEQPPEHWGGWPDGKKFAFVLTHDVEGTTGLQRCRQLMEVDRQLGFRSSFNFIPEGDYQVPAGLREDLIANGFEVGIHDLRHDGRLYQSKREFKQRAACINRYLADWQAVGFRSAFMLHNLDWLHELNIGYDASTFDTDPFEPQPEGRHTIFPFWVSRLNSASDDEEGALPTASQAGYVELPYTLPQDFTLFSLLGETSIDVWIKKLDLIAAHGGMALVDTHPDYMAFSGNPCGRSGEYSARLYEMLLQYVRSRYPNEYWQPLPKDMAAFVFRSRTSVHHSRLTAGTTEQISSIRTASGDGQINGRPMRRPVDWLRGKRAAVLLFSYYPADPRPRRAAEALAREGVLIDLVCLQKGPREPRRETINGVRIHRIPLQRRRRGKIRYIGQYSLFILRSFLHLSFRSVIRRYDLVHVHNMPDVLVFSALIPKALGAQIILDLHDPMPELMMSIYSLGAEKRFVRLLKRLEKLSIAFADLVLTPNRAFRELFISRGCPPDKIQIVMNSPESEIFRNGNSRSIQLSGNGSHERSFRIMYHGLIAERHGLDTAVEAIARLRNAIPGLEFHIFGDRTGYMDQVEAQVRQLGLQTCVHYHGYRPQIEIARAICSTDLGIIPNKRNPFTELNMPTRIFEYLAMGKPVVIPDTRGVRDYFGSDSALFFEPNDPESLTKTILDVYLRPEKLGSILERGKAIYDEHRWEMERSKFLDDVGLLFSPAGKAR